jgi:hypothetical protein
MDENQRPLRGAVAKSVELMAQVSKEMAPQGDHPGILERSGRVLMSGWDTVVPSRYYMMGLNPGGDPRIIQPGETIGASLSEEREAGWCAFLDDQDCREYTRVPDVLRQLGADPRRTPISNLLFLRSPDWLSKPKDSWDVFKRHCMPSHRLLLAKIEPCVIVAFGEDVGLWLTGVSRRQWGFHADVDWTTSGIAPLAGLLLLPHFGNLAKSHWAKHEVLLDAAIAAASRHNPL